MIYDRDLIKRKKKSRKLMIRQFRNHNCTAQGSPGLLGPWTSTLQCGPWFQPFCPKLGPRPAEATGLGSMPLCLTQGPLDMQSWTVHLMVHSRRPARPTPLSQERDCLGILYLNCPVSPWRISLPNVPLKMGTSSKATTPIPN